MYWLVKSEPEAYSFADLLRDGHTAWTGVRSAQARNNLRLMQPGEPVLFYHSVSEKQLVGEGRVAAPAVPDPTAPPDSPWLSVDLAATRPLPHPVPLAAMKADPRLADLGLIRQSRLSVVPLTEAEYRALLELGGMRNEE